MRSLSSLQWETAVPDTASLQVRVLAAVPALEAQVAAARAFGVEIPRRADHAGREAAPGDKQGIKLMPGSRHALVLFFVFGIAHPQRPVAATAAGGHAAVRRLYLDAPSRYPCRRSCARSSTSCAGPRAAQAGAEVVVPAVPPPDMKASVLAALQHLEGEATGQDVWLLAPADMPTLSPDVIKKLLQAARQSFGTILIPTANGRRGHPVLFRWPMAAAVATLAADQGVNELLRQFPVTEVPCQDEAILADVDTPEDYRRLRP